MTVFSTDVADHVRRTAPALAGGAIDYRLLLDGAAAPLDLFDARRHLGTVTGPELAEEVRRRAAALSGRGVDRGDRIVLVAATTVDYLATLLAALLIGAVPCSVAPPPTPSRPDSAGVRHLRAAIAVIDPVLVAAEPRIAAALPAVGFDELRGPGPAGWPAGPAAAPGDIHHIQLTSGSTSAPKAVVLSHANVAHNIAVLAHAMAVAPDRDRVFSWLPLYHDMGLVQVLGALIYRLPLGLMAPMAFLRDPLAWPRHMTAHRSTVTAGPPFAYRAAAEALARADGGGIDGIDLSALRFGYVGAEPIPVSTLRMVTDGYAPLGLRPDALVPCYGMAESVLATTLALRAAPAGGFGRVHTGRAGPHPPVVCCGTPVDGMRVRITGPDGLEVPDGVVGEIRISGPSVMLGYRRSDGTLSTPPGGWHDTGDRGFLERGELFVVGRSKEMLIVRGRNLPPYDIEREIETLPQIGCAVVFSAPDERRGREAVVAVVGTRPGADDPAALRDAVAAAVRRAFGFSADDIVLLPRGRIPRTTSGKIQRLTVRERYLAGVL